MFDLDLLYVKYRQQELWQEAAAQALTAKVQPERPRWWARVLDTLKTLFSGFPWLGLAARESIPGTRRCACIAPQTWR